MNTKLWLAWIKAWAGVSALLVLTCGCAPPVRCWQEHELKARMVEVYDADAQSTFDLTRLPAWLRSGSHPTCGVLEGLGAGSELSLVEVPHSARSRAPNCTPFSARVASRSDVEFREADYNSLLAEFDLYADGVLTLPDGCTGEWTLGYLSGDRLVGTPWTPGVLPPAIWVRYFHTRAAESCPTLPAGSSGDLACVDMWAGELLVP